MIIDDVDSLCAFLLFKRRNFNVGDGEHATHTSRVDTAYLTRRVMGVGWEESNHVSHDWNTTTD